MRKAYVVLGLGFGDEGKGLVTDYLAYKNPNSIVIRYCGGHQAGHTVETSDGKKHTFSNFGSGTLRGINTYWSKYCTFEPVAVSKEFDALVQLGVNPRLFIDKLCPVTTPYDIMYNRVLEILRGNAKHGSCGVGIGTTMERMTTPYKLYAQDLAYQRVLNMKMNVIRQYYLEKVKGSPYEKEFSTVFFDSRMEEFYQGCQDAASIVMGVIGQDALHSSFAVDTFIFEGSQGVLLDQDFGFFPHVTRGHTTSRNAMEMMPEDIDKINICYVTRCYQTRHGAGPMTNENLYLELKNNEQENNKTNSFQGDFRIAPLDLSLLKYSLECDANYSGDNNRKLFITCLDQVEENFVITDGGDMFETSVDEIPGKLGFHDPNEIYLSYSPCSEEIKRGVLV